MKDLKVITDANTMADPEYDFERLKEVEDRHFWFRARNRVISKMVSQIVADLPAGYRVLEVGCGNGNVLRYLEQVCAKGTVVGMDPFREGLEMARQRASCFLVQGDAGLFPFKGNFHLIGMFDVLEHLRDDRTVLAKLFPMLAPRGALLITVPAHQWLWSYFDEASQHVCRYELVELEGKLKDAGFQIEYMSEYMFSLVPFLWLQRRLKRAGSGGEWRAAQDMARNDLRIVPVLNELFALPLALEAGAIARRWRLPVGTSLIAVARRPAD